VRHPSEQQVGTYTAFVYGRIEGEKVDYVLVPAGTEVLEAEIVRWSRGERYPSDHFPVIARVRLKD
jgi:endonuclease/exonuclease/phosphatase family metal-dependent hydrolase